MKRHGFIPQADDAFLLWSRNFVNGVMDNAAKEALMRKERMVTKLYIAWNPAASDAQRESIPAPKTRPEFGFKVADIMRIQIDSGIRGARAALYPTEATGRCFATRRPMRRSPDYKPLANSALLTHSPWTLNLPPEAEGKTLSGAMMRQNEKGDKGPWSEILSVIMV